MKIKVKDIRPEGIEVTGQIAAETIGLTHNDAVYFVGPLDVRARLSRVENTVMAKTRVHGRYASVCSRCLNNVEEEWSGDFLLDFLVDAQMEFVELDEDVRQEAILNLPQRVLCKQDCKGICSGCGADLNNEKCKCKS